LLKELGKSVDKLRNVLHSEKELFKSFDKLRKVLTFAEEAVKKVLASLEMC
jgi:biotin operon repressor